MLSLGGMERWREAGEERRGGDPEGRREWGGGGGVWRDDWGIEAKQIKREKEEDLS